MFFESFVDSIGHTPLIRLRGSTDGHATLLGKLELCNPSGMKDRFARNTILNARNAGILKDGDIIVESSSGTLAVGLAIVGRALGHEVHIVTDPRIDNLTLTKLHTLGASVHIVERMSQAGWQGARLEKLQDLLKQYPGAFWPRQYTNPDNPQSYTILARELIADVAKIDVLVGPVGSGGSLCGTAHALKEIYPHLLVVAVDAIGSVIFDQPDNPSRLQSGLGNSLIPANVDKNVIDQVHWLNDEEAFTATLQLAYNEQIFAGNSSGSAYCVARWLGTQFSSENTIVVIFPDRGDRYYMTFYDGHYWEKNGLVQRSLPDIPVKVPYGTTVSSWSYADMKERRLKR